MGSLVQEDLSEVIEEERLREVGQVETSGGMAHLVEGVANAGTGGSEVCSGAAGRPGEGQCIMLAASGVMKMSRCLTSSCWAVELVAEVGKGRREMETEIIESF